MTNQLTHGFGREKLMSQNRPDDYDRIVTSLLLSGTVLIYKSQNRPDDYDRIVTVRLGLGLRLGFQRLRIDLMITIGL